MAFDRERLCAELKRLDWARQLPDEVISEIASVAEVKEFAPGQLVIEADSEVEHVYFIISGRLQGHLYDKLGKELMRDVFIRGSLLGLFSALLPDRSHLRVETVEASLAIRLSLDDLLRLTAQHREFQMAMFRAAANIVKRLVVVDRDLPKPPVVCFVHFSDASRQLSRQVVARLHQLQESPCVVSDDARWNQQDAAPHRLLFENDQFIGAENVRALLLQWASHGRLVIDVQSKRESADLVRLMTYADAVFWCVRPRDAMSAAVRLQELEAAAPRQWEKVFLVWVLDDSASAPPHVPKLSQLAAGDFKTFQGALPSHQGQLFHQGVERIVRRLRGVRIGLALGGGAARGMAHLGVLKALEQHGVFVDEISGTSAGAMTGTLYAAGLDPEYLTHSFKRDLLPSWFFRQLPGSGYWYLLYKYRRRQFEPMLRKYLSRLTMDQLLIPMTTVAVDLVDGVTLCREAGDATANILESINLPPLSLPIVQAEQAVVDGGLLNNVPANALIAKGCNFVIASTVTAQLERDFMGIRSRKAPGVGRFIATIQVVLRQTLIQSYSMNAVGVAPADFVIAPDVSSFDLSEFCRADEMAVVGERATRESIAPLQAMLSKLDPQLFPASNAAVRPVSAELTTV